MVDAVLLIVLGVIRSHDWPHVFAGVWSVDTVFARRERGLEGWVVRVGGRDGNLGWEVGNEDDIVFENDIIVDASPNST